MVNPISDENIRGMRENMDDKDQVAFDAFLQWNWGISAQKIGVEVLEIVGRMIWNSSNLIKNKKTYSKQKYCKFYNFNSLL